MERRGLLRAALGLLLLTTSALVVAAPASAAELPCPPVVANLAVAAAAAAACDRPVEVGSARTENRRVFANPDGTSTVEQYAYPQRVRRADGRWADLDATLVVNPDGSLSPRASTVDLGLSGGGTGALLTGRRAGAEVTLSWPGALPMPTVDGATATYAEVLPGVDLVVTAHETGFSEVLVVKNRLAAKNPHCASSPSAPPCPGFRGGTRWPAEGGGQCRPGRAGRDGAADVGLVVGARRRPRRSGQGRSPGAGRGTGRRPSRWRCTATS